MQDYKFITVDRNNVTCMWNMLCSLDHYSSAVANKIMFLVERCINIYSGLNTYNNHLRGAKIFSKLDENIVVLKAAVFLG